MHTHSGQHDHHHDHDHHHHHHDHHDIRLDGIHRAFIWGIVLNLIFIAIEVSAGIVWGSLALLSDAGHNASDVLALVIALLAFRLMRSHPNTRYTYGYQKTSVLAALLNAVVLLIALGGIITESVHRLIAGGGQLYGMGMAAVAGVGIVINGLTALLFLRDRHKDLNISGAFWHMAGDALVSLGVVVSGLVIQYTDWFWLDAVVSLLIAVFILTSTLSLLYKGWRLSLDGVPHGVDIDQIRQQIQQLPLVQGVHDLHVWALSTTRNAFTAHIVLDKSATFEQMAALRHEVRHILEHAKIEHVTIEIEHSQEDCHQHCEE